MEYELYHHGILGMKWGIRRYQNKDGSLTAAGRKRYLNSDGSLRNKGVQKVKNDYNEQRYKNPDRYEHKMIEEDGKLTEYTIDKTMGALVSRKIKTNQSLLDYFDEGIETIKDSDIKSGENAIRALSEKNAFDGSVKDYLFKSMYDIASKEDRRFMDDYPNLIKDMNDLTGATDDGGNEMAKLSTLIESKTVNIYDSNPATQKAKSIMNKMDDAYHRWRFRPDGSYRTFDGTPDAKKAFEEYKKYKQQIIDLAIEDQGYIPSELTRNMFENLMFWD